MDRINQIGGRKTVGSIENDYGQGYSIEQLKILVANINPMAWLL